MYLIINNLRKVSRNNAAKMIKITRSWLYSSDSKFAQNQINYYVTLCAIWYYLYNLNNVKGWSLQLY